ncbi:hypothetical protein SAMN05660691_03832 [Rheinheimera pacifica]|uniref:Uncharacterized protein n=1 Tax=Rheinheimera pacifica TaxID=173990 RepID=A0A1H6NK28_9GAMM|nr:helix-turn-helix domain-containing protein [Rheinheimera pacifica]SEI11500.1 hypothetical protein SAMN05660691_03832 [Rheinheimera pacifica]
MALTEFGKAVRKARIDVGYTLLTMAEELGTTPAFLSGMETGAKKIPAKWVDSIYGFFKSKDYEIKHLSELAHVSNESIPVDGLSLQQKMLVAGFAKSQFTPEELQRFAGLLNQLNGRKDNDE